MTMTATRTARKMRRLVASFEVKAKDAKARTFTGALSTSHLDLGNGWMRDIVWPGAFKQWLSELHASDDPYVPLLDSHSGFSILNVYGHLLDAEEVLTGKTLEYELEKGGTIKVPEMYLHTEWQVIDGPDGDRVLDRLRPGSVRKMSMGYRRLKSDDVALKEGLARNLRQVEVTEGSLVVFAMNPNAAIDTESVKAALVDADPLSLSEEEKRELRALASRIGALLRPQSDEPKDAPPAEPAADAQPDGPKGEDQDDRQKPDAPPADAAAAPKAGTEPVYIYTEALHQRIAGVRTAIHYPEEL